MAFNSAEFLVFLCVTILLYWPLAKHVSIQNLLVLAASYIFYSWWDAWYLLLIVASSACDYTLGRMIYSAQRQSEKRFLLGVSLCFNLGLLFYFKYCNFFIESFAELLISVGLQPNVHSLHIILPVGISFYTFQTLSYTIDVYKGKIEPTRDVVAFFAFVSFFPQLVAGPIERASHLLPQFQRQRRITSTQFVSGIYQIVWGLFKKMVVADNCATYANEIFNNSESFSGWILLLGAIYFAFQIYGDFSGYSDIAIGTSKLLGFELMVNFRYPYFSRDIAEFWRTWHISLSTWFRDYVYIPLGGSRGNMLQQIRNVMIVFMVSGLWHGPNWTFVIWGLLNGLYFLPLLLSRKNRLHLEIVAIDSWLPAPREMMGILITFVVTVLAWVFFRADSLDHALAYLHDIVVGNWSIDRMEKTATLWLVFIMLIFEWFGRKKEQPLSFANPFRLRNFTLVCVVFWMIAIWTPSTEKEFIYFQF